ncbi:MAG: GNAT family N-acetyltransferase [Candidatus Omnitrophica bacterium]|jgi:GNAT superfamily N-acetyltransferase|nr:GNAT family N-acetyltransferase [Candidatus Omnitrophota bacterium]MDD5078843.1 GNAT family N-acetyltransferase [Candidatus Omnitrophota bacterium]
MDDIIIRLYYGADRDAVRQIACDTALMGGPGEIFFSDKEVLADFLTLYFTDYEPGSSFVAQSGSGVIGYLIGSRDSRKMGKIFGGKICGPLCLKMLIRGALFNRKNLVFIFHSLKSLIRGEFKCPDFSNDYPAVMHINLKAGFRGKGIGSRLIAAYLKHLKTNKASAVRLATFSDKAKDFFLKNGFSLLFQQTRSCFRYLLGRDVRVYIYGRKL